MNNDPITKVFSGTPFGIITRAEKYANRNNLILLTTRKEVDEQAKKIINSESLENHYVHMNYECVFIVKPKSKYIEENNMKNETITITKDGKTYEVDFEKAEELGILKEKLEYPKSWEEFVNMRGYSHMDNDNEYNALISLKKLIQLRDWWWDNMCDGWRPNHKENFVIIKTINANGDSIIDTDESWGDSYTLSFPTEEIRNKFFETYNDLIEQAKMFL